MPSDLINQTQPETQGKPEFSVLALVSTLTGALSYILVLFHSAINMHFLTAVILAPISALAAIITGHSSHRQISRSNGTISGIGLSRAGLILGYLYYAIAVVLLVLVVLGASWLIKALGIG
jgi:uncharacterized membrane protein